MAVAVANIICVKCMINILYINISSSLTINLAYLFIYKANSIRANTPPCLTTFEMLKYSKVDFPSFNAN